MELTLLPADPAERDDTVQFLGVFSILLAIIAAVVVLFVVVLPMWKHSYLNAPNALILFAATVVFVANSRLQYRLFPPEAQLAAILLVAITGVTAFLHTAGSNLSTIAGIYAVIIIFSGIYFTPFVGAFSLAASTLEYGALLYLEYTGILEYAPGYPKYQEAADLPSEFYLAFTNVALINSGGFLIAYYMNRTQRRRTEELRHARAMAEHASRLKDDFLSNVSHELRTPLTSILGYTDYLKRVHTRLAPDKIEQYYVTIIQETERLQRLINDVLDLQKMLRGKMAYHKQKTDIGSIAHNVIDNLSPLISQQHIKVISSIQNDMPAIRADPDRIGQVFTNLMSNAIKFSPERSTVRVMVQYLAGSAVQPLLHRHLRPGEPRTWSLDKPDAEYPFADCIMISIADEGRGIPFDQLDHIFGSFEQVFTADAGKDKGTGLGLPISKEIVTEHGGRVWVESHLGTGSTFYVMLPLVHTESAASRPDTVE